MTMYRTNVAGEPPEPPVPPPRRIKPLFIAVASVVLHAAVIGAAFASRPTEPTRPPTVTVQVLAGQIDPWTGDFHAAGLRTARVKN